MAYFGVADEHHTVPPSHTRKRHTPHPPCAVPVPRYTRPARGREHTKPPASKQCFSLRIEITPPRQPPPTPHPHT